jgi:hypothetical protein
MFNRLLTVFALVLTFVAGGSIGRAATVLFAQVPGPLDAAYTAWESESASQVSIGRTYDNFSLASDGDIGAVAWEGIYVNDSDASLNPSMADADSFEISFWSNDNGKPGSLLATTTIALPDANQSSVGNTSFQLASGTVDVPVFSYAAVLPVPFAAAAGQKYWISIVADSRSSQPSWSWISETGDSGSCVQDYGSSRYTREGNRAFALFSRPVPTATVVATVATAHLTGLKAGVFTFKISPAQTVDTMIAYQLKGNAVNGEDYDLLTGTITIKARKTSAKLRVVPEGTLEGAASKNVKLRITPATSYKIGVKDKATVTIDR